MFASRILSVAERNYCQMEKGALAVVWGCEKFHQYLFGKEFTLYTDHKALETIYSPKGRPSARILRWSLRLQPYHMNVKFLPGKINPADFLSRLPSQFYKNEANGEEFIRFTALHSIPKSVTAQEFIQAAVEDEEIALFRSCSHKLTRQYKTIKDSFASRYLPGHKRRQIGGTS